jgi:cystathionine gamma-synthase
LAGIYVFQNGYALTYRSGLAAGYSALVHYKPKRVAITLGYHGLHAAVALYRRGAPIVSRIL